MHFVRTALTKRSRAQPEQAESSDIGTPNEDLEKSKTNLESKEEAAADVNHPEILPSKDNGDSKKANEKTESSLKEQKRSYKPGEEQRDGKEGKEVKESSDATTVNDDEEKKYPGGTKLGLLTFGLAMATFVVALDNTIIATAIPRITTQFHSLDDVGWYGSSYLLTTTSLQPSFGKVYAYFDVKWVYLSALIIFEGRSVQASCNAGADSYDSGIYNLRNCDQLQNVDRWTCCRRSWSSSFIFWRHEHYRL